MHPRAPGPSHAFWHAPPFQHVPHRSGTCPRPAPRCLTRADTPRPPHTCPALSADPPTQFHVTWPPLDMPRPLQHAQPLFNVLLTPQAHPPTSLGMPCPLGMRPPHEDVPPAHHSRARPLFTHPSQSDMLPPLQTCPTRPPHAPAPATAPCMQANHPECALPLLDMPWPPLTHFDMYRLVLGKFGLVRFRAIFAGPETGQSSP